MNSLPRWQKVLIGLGIAALLYWVWPTPYVYGHTAGRQSRRNRFTDTIQYYSGEGWHSGAYFRAHEHDIR